MRITSLHVRNIRRHTDLAVEFAPGLNVVCGPNEAGKSTLQKGIEMALFRKATSASQDLAELRPWSAAPTDDPQIELDFDEDGVHGRLIKSFAGPQGSVSLEMGGETLTDPGRVDHAIAELTGLPSEKFYRSTAGIRHSEVSTLDGEDGGLRDRLQKSMSGADRGTAQAKRRLQEAIRQYRLEGTRNHGPLRQARDAIARYRAELSKGEAELQRLERDRAGLAAATTRRVALDRHLGEEEGQLAHAEHAVDLVAKERDAQQRYERYKRAAELRVEIDGLERGHLSGIPLDRLRDGVDRLRQTEFDISEIRAELASEPDPSTYQAAPVPSGWKVWATIGILLVIAAIGVGAFAVISGAIVALGAAVPLALLGAALVIRAGRMRALAADVRRGNDLLEADVHRRLRGRSERHDRVRAAERERDAILASVMAPDMAAAERLLVAETERLASIARLRAEERGRLGDLGSDGDMAGLRDAAAAEAEQARHALTGLRGDGRDPSAERMRLRASVEAMRHQRDSALGEEGQARGRVEANEVDAERVAAVAESLDEAEARLHQLERRLRIYEATHEAIEKAEGQTMQKAARFLEQHMGRDIAALTGGRYRRIQVDEQTLAFKVFSPERGDWISSTSLSRGTLDQLYLAARLGLVRQLTGDRQPPLILDDPFVTFDDARATNAVQLLKRLSADFQVIYFTCSNRYDTLADRVIELPEPLGRDVEDGADPGGTLPGDSADGSLKPAVVSRPGGAASAQLEGPSLWDEAEPVS